MEEFKKDPNPWSLRKRMEIGLKVDLDHFQIQKWHYDQRRRSAYENGTKFQMTYYVKPKGSF